MHSATDRLEFAPLRDPDSLRSFALALLVHALLIGALTWGVNWKRNERDTSFEAELWSALPQQAAPRLTEAPPPPPPPAARTPEARPAPRTPDADIALKQDKKRKRLQQQKEAEAKKEKELKAKEELAKRKAAEEAQKAEAKKQDAKAQAKQKLAEAATEKLRQENIRRIAGLAGATGGANATGSAQKSSGPSASYQARLAALFHDNITFSNVNSIQGNPKAVVQVQVSPSGLIMSKRLTKSSGVTAWDDAVLRAVEKTERIPLDENGKVVPDFPVEFGPKDKSLSIR